MSGGFQDLGLLPELVRATQDLGWLLPSDVQDEAVPLMLGGGDVMVAAETGSGKTAAFALPVLQLCHEIRRDQQDGSADRRAQLQAQRGAAAGAAAQAAGPSMCLSSLDRTPIVTVGSDGKACQCRHPRQWGGVRATVGVRGGDAFFEVTVEDDGISRVGWSTTAGKLDLGTDASGWGYGGTGKKSNARNFETYGEAFSAGDVIGCLLRYRAASGGESSVRFFRNGRDLGEAFRIPAAALAKGKALLFPTLSMKNGQMSVNLGGPADRPFRFPPPAGAAGVASQGQGITAEEPSLAAAARAAADGAAASTGGGSQGASAANQRSPLALLVAPAKDLAEQTARAIVDLSKHVCDPPLRSALVIGGIDNRKMTKDLQRGTDVVVGTPGKLLDLSRPGGPLNLGSIRVLVLDEADRFCDEEGMADILKLWERIPKQQVGGERLQVGFFSATLHSDQVHLLSGQLCHHPTWVDLKGKDSVPDTVHHLLVEVDPRADQHWRQLGGVPTDDIHHADGVPTGGRPGKVSELHASEGVKRLKPAMLVGLLDSLRMEQCLVFCRTNLDCENLARYLTQHGDPQRRQGFSGKRESGKENPYSCAVLAGGARNMQQRREALQAFQEGDIRVLICTDVAARGIDVKGLPFVVNMTLPDEPEQYIHRIGRVGRADRMGLAVSLVATTRERVWFVKDKKYKPWWQHTRKLDIGRNSIWYNEQQMLRAIERRLGLHTEQQPQAGGAAAAGGGGAGGDAGHLPRMAFRSTGQGEAIAYEFELPAALRGVAFGEESGAVAGQSEHVVAIRPAVETLAAMEAQSQGIFLALQQHFRTA